MRSDFLKFQLLLIGIMICFFKMSYAQIKVEQELMFHDDTLFVFNKNGQRGLGKDSNTVLYQYDSIVLGAHSYINLAMKQGKWGTIDNDNNIKIPLKYDGVLVTFLRDIVMVKRGNKWGVIDDEDQVLIPFKYDKILSVFASSDLFFAEKNGKWGLINEKNKVLLPFEYDSLRKGDNIKIKEEAYETIIVKKNGKFGMVNNKNKILLPIIYDGILNRSEYGPYGYYVIKDGKKGFVSEEGKLLIPCIYDAINYNYYVKLFRIKQDNKYGLTDYNNKSLLSVVFNKIYLDEPFYYDKTSDNAKIVVQDLDSAWHYLSVKDGSVLQANVPKDSVFKYYKTELFGAELMEEYKQKVSEKEGRFATGLDTFHQQLVDEIIDSKGGIQIDFPDLHKTAINFIPDFIQIMSLSKIRDYLLARSFEIRATGERMDERATERRWCWSISLPDRECSFEISFHKTFNKEEYKIIESLKCTAQNNSYRRIRRYHDVHRDQKSQ